MPAAYIIQNSHLCYNDMRIVAQNYDKTDKQPNYRVTKKLTQ